MSKLLKILGIVFGLSLIGYGITYPHELSYEGEKDIVLIDMQDEVFTLNNIIKRPEFKDKVLYIRIGKLFAFEIKTSDFTKIESIVNSKLQKNHKINRFADYRRQLNGFKQFSQRYKDKDVAFVFLEFPDSESNSKEDETRKWKSIIKNNKIKGFHILINSITLKKLLSENKKLSFKQRNHVLVNKQGNIVNLNAPSTSFNRKLVYQEIDSLLSL